MTIEPLVSVITTVRNCEKFIGEAVGSILHQTYKNLEYIIVDDGSTDKTKEIINQFLGDRRLRLISFDKNLGRVTSLNTALAESKGKYIAIHDADDVSMPERIKKQVAFLEKNPEYVLIGSNIIEIDIHGNEVGNPRKPTENADLQFSIMLKCTLVNPSTMFRKCVCDEHKIRYEKRFIHAEDFGFISRLAGYGKVHNLEEILLKYRRHPNNNSKVNFGELDSSSTEIARLNLWHLGLHLESSQVKRIRALISSKGISKDHVLEDVSVLLKAIEIYIKKNGEHKYKEIESILLRMPNWLGRKNILLKSSYKSLNTKIRELRKELGGIEG